MGKSGHPKDKKEPAMQRGGVRVTGQSEGLGKDPRRSGNHQSPARLVRNEGITA